VTPGGSRAASAGFFILLSADIAAMAPGTHTGAASPLLAVGGYPVPLDPTLEKKIVSDATAFLRSYAAPRGRNPQLAETAVTEARAFTVQEALEGHLVDLEASSVDDLLAKLNGRAVKRFDGETSTLSLVQPAVTVVDMSSRQRFMARVAQPDIFFVLLIVGVLGLYVEVTHPGFIVPGVVGAIALILALFAMQILPINVTGLLLLALALGLFVLEAKFTSHGILGLGGAVAMLIGALMLVRSPLTGWGVSLGAALGATVPFAIITVVLMRLVLRSRGWTPQTGVEQLVHDTAEVRRPIGGGPAEAARGLVFVRGELWRAASAGPIPAGARVRVVRADGLTLWVEPVESAAGAERSGSAKGDVRG
jgi:membrane-bound serine protease (ClpP class)